MASQASDLRSERGQVKNLAANTSSVKSDRRGMEQRPEIDLVDFAPSDIDIFAEVERPRSKLPAVLVSLVALCGFGAVVWYGYSWGNLAAKDGELPIITADLDSEKIRPSEPGGLEVPHQDTLVLNQLEPSGIEDQEESLLPPPETPMTPPLASLAEPADRVGDTSTPTIAATESLSDQSIDGALEEALSDAGDVAMEGTVPDAGDSLALDRLVAEVQSKGVLAEAPSDSNSNLSAQTPAATEAPATAEISAATATPTPPLKPGLQAEGEASVVEPIVKDVGTAAVAPTLNGESLAAEAVDTASLAAPQVATVEPTEIPATDPEVEATEPVEAEPLLQDVTPKIAAKARGALPDVSSAGIEESSREAIQPAEVQVSELSPLVPDDSKSAASRAGSIDEPAIPDAKPVANTPKLAEAKASQAESITSPPILEKLDTVQPAEPAVAPAKIKPAAKSGPSYGIQLASVRSNAAAEAEWRRLQQRHGDLLGDMSLVTRQVDLGDRGIFHRIQTGPFPNRTTAADMCSQLKAQQQDCLVVRR